MAAPPETAEASAPPAGDEAKGGVEVCLFDESPDGFSRTVRAISELATGEPEPDFPDAEVERLACSITFLREWRDFSYMPRGVSFTSGTESASSSDDMHSINLPQFSSASVPQITQQEDRRDNTVSKDFILFAGGNVWTLDWCPRLCNKPGSSINCEYLAVSAHPPGSSYHKLGMPLTGRGIIQVWCLLAPFEGARSSQPMYACNKSRRGRPRKTPDGNNSVGSSSNPPKPRGRPRKRPIITPGDQSEPVLKRPRGRPRKYPLPVAKVEDSSQNSKSQDIVLYDPLATSTVMPDDLPLAYAMPTTSPAEPAPRRGRGRPRKNPIDKLTSSSGTLLKEDVCTAPSSTTETCMKPKRPRGRPRKYPVSSNGRPILGTDVELGKDITCQSVSSDCNLDHTACPDSAANLSIVAVDATLPVSSSLTSVYENKSESQRCRGQNKEEPSSSALGCSVVSGVESQSTSSRGTISNDPVVSDALPSAQSNIVSLSPELCSVSMVSCEGNVHKIGLQDDSVLPIHISPKSSDKRESSGRRGRGRPRKKPLSAATSCFVASGAKPQKKASVLTSSDNLSALDKNGVVVASNLGSVGSCGCDTEKCSVHLSAVLSDAALPVHDLYNANCKEESSTKRGRGGSRKKPVSTKHSCSTYFNGEEQITQTTPKSSDHVAVVENNVKETLPRVSGEQSKKISASNESSSTAIGEAQTMERSSESRTEGSCRSENIAEEAGLIGSKNGHLGCEAMKVNESNTQCNIENAQANQVAPVFKDSARVIDVIEATELVPLEESREGDNTFSCIENFSSSPIPEDIALPRVVLCLAHNGKVAWDIKWKPPLVNQTEQKSCLGFLAVLLGNGSLEVGSSITMRDPGNILPFDGGGFRPSFSKAAACIQVCQSEMWEQTKVIPLAVDWSPSPPHDMILAGCHDGTVALWNFSTNLSSQEAKPFMCVTAESVPIRALSWAPYISEENINTFVTAGEDGLKFWDVRDPYRPLWELTTAPRAVLSLHWLKDARGIVISLEDGTLKFLSLPRIANDVAVTGKPFVGTKTQGVSTYQLSEYLIWSVHASESTGMAAYCGADGTAVHFQLTSRFWEKEPGRNRAPYFLCGSLSEEGNIIKIGSDSTLQKSPLPNVPVGAKKGPKPCLDIDLVNDMGQEKPQNITDSGYSCTVNPEHGEGQEYGRNEEQGTGAIILASPKEQENARICDRKDNDSPKEFEIFPPRAVALHRLRWNTNKGSERWLCYGGAAGIIRCQRI
ncbi:hypothetical protein ACP70R_036403 [Stipagrostis hirtigluma subsp. patula]